MTKHIALFLLVISYTLISPNSAEAQVLVPADEPLVNQYVSDSYSMRRASWWNLLGRELAESVDKSYEDVSTRELQNIIFFASNHGKKVNLTDAVPALLNIFRNHENEQIRIMSVAAIDAIGDKKAILELQRLVEDESSERVKKIALAAVDNFSGAK